MDSTSPRYGEKASYYSAVCLETGEVEWMELEGNSNSETSAGFLEQLRERHSGRLNVIWDNAPAHRGEAVREWLGTRALVRERVSGFPASLSKRKEEVKRRCRTVRQSKAGERLRNSHSAPQYHTNHIPPWLWFSSQSTWFWDLFKKGAN